MKWRLSQQGTTTLNRVRGTIPATDIDERDVRLTFGPAAPAENWSITRMTSRGVLTVNDGALVLPLPFLRIWRGPVGGYLLDKYGSLPDPTTGKSLDKKGESHDAISQTSVDLFPGEYITAQYTWVPTMGPVVGALKFESWVLTFYIEGEARHGLP